MNGTIKERIIAKGKDQSGKLKENLKVYDVYYRFQDPATGLWKQTSKKGFRRKGDAEAFLLRVNSQMSDNSFVKLTKCTLRDYLVVQFITDYVEPNLRASSVAGYKVNINKHILPYIGNIELQSLSTYHIDDLYKKLYKAGNGLSAKSILYVHRVLSKALNLAVKQSLLSKNPATLATLPRVKKPKTNILEKDEILKLLNHIKGTDMEVPIALAALCGLRRGEVLGLAISDVDLDQMTIRIHRQLIPTKDGLVFESPKSEDSTRVVCAPREVIDMIQSRINCIEEYKKIFGDEWQENGLLNTYPDGRMIDPRNFSKMFAKTLKTAGIKHVRFHDLRHSAASLMLAANVPMKVASQILGHSSISITADLYQHVISDLKKDAADKIGSMLYGKKTDQKESNDEP